MNQNRLKTIRKEKGFTQQQMAEMLGYKDKSGYCQLENGTVKMTLDKALKISNILGIKPEEIFFECKVKVSSTYNKAI